MKRQLPEGWQVMFSTGCSYFTPSGRMLSKPHRFTRASIYDHLGNFLAEGQAMVREECDTYDAALGRRIAQGRALKRVQLPA